MMWIVGMAAIVIGFVLVVAVGVAILALLIELLVRLVLGVVLAAVMGVLAGVAAHQTGFDPLLTGVLVGLVSLIPTIMIVSHWRSPVTMGQASVVEPSASPLADDPVDPFGKAWARARQLAPRNCLDSAQDASMRLIQMVDRQGSIDPEIIDYAVMIRRHTPALVSETEELLATADRAERRSVVAELVADLESLGKGAAALLERRNAGARERLEVRRLRLFGEGRLF